MRLQLSERYLKRLRGLGKKGTHVLLPADLTDPAKLLKSIELPGLVRADEWMLYVQDSPSASGALSFNRGNIFTRQGELVASVTQEGLLRPVERRKQA